ncbi:MAG: hypothetical protein HC942_21550 [Microcoleus sp. SU_5_6]|nr:hypothetical protein [Microcoleus sp. SU_5_6]
MPSITVVAEKAVFVRHFLSRIPTLKSSAIATDYLIKKSSNYQRNE